MSATMLIVHAFSCGLQPTMTTATDVKGLVAQLLQD